MRDLIEISHTFASYFFFLIFETYMVWKIIPIQILNLIWEETLVKGLHLKFIAVLFETELKVFR